MSGSIYAARSSHQFVRPARYVVNKQVLNQRIPVRHRELAQASPHARDMVSLPRPLHSLQATRLSSGRAPLSAQEPQSASRGSSSVRGERAPSLALALGMMVALGACNQSNAPQMLPDGSVVQDAPAPKCGDGIVTGPKEKCDDGNAMTEVCPRGIEEGCMVCAEDCTVQPGMTSFCGDGIVQPEFEQCDDINKQLGDGCENDCTLPRCGNGIVDQGEQCDDFANHNPNDGCDDQCKLTTPICGDGIVELNEQCDDGNNVNDDACKNDCTLNVCGDKAFWKGVEECDDGNNVNETCTYGVISCFICNATCMLTQGATSFCGDKILDVAHEECDDGNLVNNDGCNSTCKLE